MSSSLTSNVFTRAITLVMRWLTSAVASARAGALASTPTLTSTMSGFTENPARPGDADDVLSFVLGDYWRGKASAQLRGNNQ